VLTAIEVLEHLPPGKLQEFIRTLHELLKANGVLIITVPSTNVRVRSKHYQHFDISLLRELLHDYFEIDTHYFLNKVGFRRKIIHNLLSNSVFILNAKNMLNSLYRYYVRKLLIADEKDAQRICVLCRKKQYDKE
jgi:2-polyprenyl-3-methyl-5-hydroxy-6-metoxy-1,4-benzoquinol methylase